MVAELEFQHVERKLSSDEIYPLSEHLGSSSSSAPEASLLLMCVWEAADDG